MPIQRGPEQQSIANYRFKHRIYPNVGIPLFTIFNFQENANIHISQGIHLPFANYILEIIITRVKFVCVK
jgi:hypothetical protein